MKYHNIPQHIDPTRLVPAIWSSSAAAGMGSVPDEAYVDREQGVVVQVWKNREHGCKGTPWEGTMRVAVKHTSAKTREQAEGREHSIPISWDSLQAIKDHFWPGQIAIEIYPPQDKIVNVADLRWLWVLPKGAVLPFNLQGGNPDRLES